MALEAGLDRREVSKDEMLSIEPTLNLKLIGGFYTKSDMSGIFKVTKLLARLVKKRVNSL